MRCWSNAGTTTTSTTSARSTAPTSTGIASSRTAWRMATSCRSASSSSRSSLSDAHGRAGRTGNRTDRDRPRRRRAAQGDDHRRGLQGARAGVPGHLDLEDPLPRGSEAAGPEAHAGWLPPVLGRRRPAAAHDPAPAARRVPAPAGHPAGARIRARGQRRRRAGRGRRCAAQQAPAVGHRAVQRGALLARRRDRGDPGRPAPGLRARGVRRDQGRDPRGDEVLRRDRARDRARGDRARPLRRGRAQPARVSHERRSRGGAAAADPRPGAALAQRQAPQGGDRGPGEPRRGHHAPQAPAADPRPAQDRLVVTDLAALVRDIPDFPKPGIVFKDITPILASAEGLDAAVRELADLTRDLRVDVVIGAEARGFLLGPALARELGAGFVLARKPGKLPHDTVRAEYLLEYGTDALELHSDAVAAGARVLVHDDLLATGGTAKALCELVEQLDGEVVGCAFLIELAFLNGRERLAGYDVRALLQYDHE